MEMDLVPQAGPSKQDLAQGLAGLLGDTVTFKFLSHGYHWNVRGKHFAQFHEFFSDIYEDADSAVDPLAESIRKLGFDAPFLLQDLAALSCIQPRPVSADPVDMAGSLYEANNYIIDNLKNIFTVANALNEQGIANLLAERIDMHQKWQWQLGTIIGADATATIVEVTAPVVVNVDDMGKSNADLPVVASSDVVDQPDAPVYVSNIKANSYPTKRVTFSTETESMLSKMAKTYNSKAGTDDPISVATLRAVYRRGVRAFTASGQPESERDSWADARLRAFVSLLENGKPSNARYTQDNDLLPITHRLSTVDRSQGLTASLVASRDLVAEIKPESAYSSPEDAIYSLAEYSGLGYEAVPAFRAVWKRAIDNYEPPFNRAVELATMLYVSRDSDLLPKK
jgi:starvation-inducible DNA-binding protein